MFELFGDEIDEPGESVVAADEDTRRIDQPVDDTFQNEVGGDSASEQAEEPAAPPFVEDTAPEAHHWIVLLHALGGQRGTKIIKKVAKLYRMDRRGLASDVRSFVLARRRQEEAAFATSLQTYGRSPGRIFGGTVATDEDHGEHPMDQIGKKKMRNVRKTPRP